jgi:hypothetical protein
MKKTDPQAHASPARPFEFRPKCTKMHKKPAVAQAGQPGGASSELLIWPGIFQGVRIIVGQVGNLRADYQSVQPGASTAACCRCRTLAQPKFQPQQEFGVWSRFVFSTWAQSPNRLASLWRAHSCVPRRPSWRRICATACTSFHPKGCKSIAKRMKKNRSRSQRVPSTSWRISPKMHKNAQKTRRGPGPPSCRSEFRTLAQPKFRDIRSPEFRPGLFFQPGLKARIAWRPCGAHTRVCRVATPGDAFVHPRAQTSTQRSVKT